jgi:hypothetical protein
MMDRSSSSSKPSNLLRPAGLEPTTFGSRSYVKSVANGCFSPGRVATGLLGLSRLVTDGFSHAYIDKA